MPHTPQGWWSPDPPPRRAALGREQTPASRPPCRWTRQGYGRGAAGLGRERAVFWPGSHMGHCGPASAAFGQRWGLVTMVVAGGRGAAALTPVALGGGLHPRESKGTGSGGCGQVPALSPPTGGAVVSSPGQPSHGCWLVPGISFLPSPLSPAPTPPPQASSSFWKEARQMARRLHQA